MKTKFAFPAQFSSCVVFPQSVIILSRHCFFVQQELLIKLLTKNNCVSLSSPQTDMCCIGAAIRLNLTPPRLSVTDISFKHYLTPSLISVGDPVSRVARRNLSSQREALADIKTEVDKNQNVTRRSKHSGAWESVIGLEVHAQVTRI